MSGGLSNQPKLLRGAFVDSNVTAIPPLILAFQFNPDRVTRRKTSTIRTPPSRAGREESTPERQAMGEAQTTLTSPETITFDIRLDATDALESGDAIAGRFGVLPALSTLELMITPRSESIIGNLLGLTSNFGFGARQSTPVLIFVWGRHRLYPMRLVEINIQETEYNANLTPIRVTAGVTIQVLAGGNAFYRFTQAQREVLAALNPTTAPGLVNSILNF
jgi:hypothetical protein